MASVGPETAAPETGSWRQDIKLPRSDRRFKQSTVVRRSLNYARFVQSSILFIVNRVKMMVNLTILTIVSDKPEKAGAREAREALATSTTRCKINSENGGARAPSSD
jgi:hypothetical protein